VKRLRILLATLSVMVAPVMMAGNALAWSPFQGVDCSGAAAKSAVCTDKQSKSNPLTGKDGLLLKITNIIAVIAGIAAVIIIILSGLRMVTSGGSSEDVAGARRSIIYALIGLVVIVVARTLIGYVLGRL
jgi:hypothetical protein